VDPQILVIDEALSVGDELFQRKCFARIEAIRDQGATVLFVSHAAGTVIDLCDRALLVDSGELLSEGQPKLIVSRYHKLLYAPAGEADAVREEIRQAAATAATTASASWGSASGAPSTRSEDDAEARQSETYDPGLVPSSTVNFASKGALIQRPSIWTRDGRVVNGLVRGRRYCFGFNVVFSKQAYYVRFGSLIRGITGLPICGTMSAARLLDGKAEAAAGQSANVEFWFDCMLNPGIYFMNAGVFGVEQLGQEETLLHRIADAIAFRVLPITDNASTELADFNCESQVQFSG
jgi:lipopolysaccharide transport system ATP-binding protein